MCVQKKWKLQVIYFWFFLVFSSYYLEGYKSSKRFLPTITFLFPSFASNALAALDL
jgi:hypothetical protein